MDIKDFKLRIEGMCNSAIGVGDMTERGKRLVMAAFAADVAGSVDAIRKVLGSDTFKSEANPFGSRAVSMILDMVE